MRLLAVALTTLTLLPATALAEESARADVRVESFDDELVDGDLLRPTGDQIILQGRTARRTLIRAREHFNPEMLRSVERL